MSTITTTSHQRRPSVSNWFSSLRRQPKAKKSANASDSCSDNSNKKLQRSCVDLSSSTSTFYITAEDDDDRRGLLNGKNVRQLCSQCCCQLPAANKSKISDDTYSSPSPPSSLLKQFTSSFTSTNNTPSNPNQTGEMKIETNFTNDIQIKTKKAGPDSRTILYEKRSELKKTVRTTITRTTILTRPKGLIFGDDGEILTTTLSSSSATGGHTATSTLPTKSKQLQTEKQRASSLDSILDCDDHRKTFYSSLELEDDFLYIDDNSSSSGPSETNDLIKSQSKTSNNKNKNKNLSANSCNNNNNNNSNHSNSNNKSNQVMCNNCNKNVLSKMKGNNDEQTTTTTTTTPAIPETTMTTLKRGQKQIKDELCEVVSEMEALDSQEDCKHSNKDKQMSIGRKKFNMDPKKGIEYLVDNHLLRMDPQDIAHFLYKGEGLNKTAIGDYLGEKNDFNEQVLKAFVELHDFTNLILVQALRQFLWSFRLPGEAQKIDRMMECFAQRYCQLNPDIFTNTDTCYVLSFAIIMLNTSLHNPSVKDKPTVEQFISMNRGINNGGDLPRGLLESLYESIRTEPFKIPQDDGNDLMHTFFNPDKEGWLWKQGGRYKSWKRRWFILNDNCLYYFEYTTDKEPRGIIPLENISVREIQDRNKPHCFELYACGGADIIKACKTDSEGKVVEGKHTVYRMSAATEEDKQEWIKRLTQSISHNPFYDILVQRKKKALAKSKCCFCLLHIIIMYLCHIATFCMLCCLRCRPPTKRKTVIV